MSIDLPDDIYDEETPLKIYRIHDKDCDLAELRFPVVSQGADAQLLVGRVPGAGQPHAQWRAGLLEDSSGRH